MNIKAVAFDAYGTLFDVYSVGALAEEIFPDHGSALAEIWRDKQIEYTRLRTICDRYVPFWQVTGDALDFACDKLNLPLDSSSRARLMDQYANLKAFEENKAQLGALRQLGLPLAILSNGNPEMIDSAVASAGLEGLFDHLLSVDTVSKFKTAPEAYQLGPDAFGVPTSDILFVSSNGWDICGATWFGYITFWLNRANNPLERLGVAPVVTGRSLADVTEFVKQQNG